MKNIQNKGFTLIELIIAVAIIAILAATAIASYQTYTTRTKITEVFSLSTTIKSALHEYNYFNTEMPENNNAVVTGAATGMATASTIINTATYNKVDNRTATLEVELTNLGNDVSGKTLIITYYSDKGTITSVCDRGGTLQQQYRPHACRN